MRRDELTGVARPRDKGESDEAALKVGRRTRFNMVRIVGGGRTERALYL